MRDNQLSMVDYNQVEHEGQTAQHGGLYQVEHEGQTAQHGGLYQVGHEGQTTQLVDYTR